MCRYAAGCAAAALVRIGLRTECSLVVLPGRAPVRGRPQRAAQSPPRQASLGESPTRGGLQLGSDLLVGSRSRLRPVPRAALRIDVGIKNLRDGPVRCLTFISGCGAVDRLARQGMLKLDVQADHHQATAVGVGDRVIIERRYSGRAAQQRRIAERFCRRFRSEAVAVRPLSAEGVPSG